jgi:hypothetical protein
VIYIFNCNWVDTRWQQYITHLHTKYRERRIQTDNKNVLPGGPTGPDSPGYPGLPIIPGGPGRPGVPISPGEPCKYSLRMSSPVILLNSLTVEVYAEMCVMGINLSNSSSFSTYHQV